MKEWYSTSGKDGVVIGVGVLAMFFGLLRGCTGTGPALDQVDVEQPATKVEQLVSQLTDDAEDKRVQAAEALGALGTEAESSAANLVNALADESNSVRTAVANAIPKVDGQGSSIGALVDAAEAEQDAEVRSVMWTSAGLMTSLWNADSEGTDSDAEFPANAFASLSGKSENVTDEDGSSILSAIAAADSIGSPATDIASIWLNSETSRDNQAAALSLLSKSSSKNSAATDAMLSALRSSDESLRTELEGALSNRDLSPSQQVRSTLYQGLLRTPGASDNEALQTELQPNAGLAVAQLLSEAQDSSSPQALRAGALGLLRNLLTNAEGDISLENLPEDQREAAQEALITADFDKLDGPAARADIATLMAHLGDHPQLKNQLLAAASSTEVEDDVRIEALRKLPEGTTPIIVDQLLRDMETASKTAAEADDKDLRSQLQQEQLTALKRFGDASAVSKIAALMSEVKDPTLQGVALDTAVSLDPKSEGTVELVSSALAADDPQLVSMALNAAPLLPTENSDDVLPKVAALMSDATHRDEALKTLSLQPENRAAYSGDIAMAMTEADDPKFRSAAMKLLTEHSGELKNLPKGQSEKLAAAMVDTLSKNDAESRSQSLGLLSQSGLIKNSAVKYPGITDALVELASKEDKEARDQALQALAAAGQLPENATKAIVPLLSKAEDVGSAKLMLQTLNNSATSEADVQKNLSLALANDELSKEAAQLSESLGDRQVAVLSAIAASDDAASRESSLGVLSQLAQTDEGKAKLAAAQQSGDSNSKAIASLMLGKLPQGMSEVDQQMTLASALSMPGLSGQVQQLMSSLSEKSIAPLSAIANDPEISPQTRLNAVKQLAAQADGKNSDAVARALEQTVASDKGRTGTESALAVASVDPKSTAALERLAADISREVPGVAPGQILASLEHMAASGNGEAIAKLANVVTNKKLPRELKQKAFDAIVSRDHKLAPVQNALAELANKDDGDFGNEAAMALIEVDPSSEPAATRLAQSIASSKSPKAAARMMASLSKSAAGGSDHAVAGLAELAQSKDAPESVRSQALAAIVGSESKSPAINQSLEAIAKDSKSTDAAKAALALAKRDPKSVVAAQQLAKVAADKDSEIPAKQLLNTLKTMSEQGNKQAPAAIANLATSEKTPPAVSTQAITSLANAKESPEALEAIEKIVSNKGDVGVQAAMALASADSKSATAARRLAEAISDGKSAADVQPMIDAVSSLEDSARSVALDSVKESASQKGVTPAMLALAEKSGLKSPVAATLVAEALTNDKSEVQKSALRLAKQMDTDSSQAVENALWEQLNGEDKQSAAAALTELVDDAIWLKKLTEVSLKDPDLADQLPALISRQEDGGAAALKEVMAVSDDAELVDRLRSQLQKLSETEDGKERLQKLMDVGVPGVEKLMADATPAKAADDAAPAKAETDPSKEPVSGESDVTKKANAQTTNAGSSSKGKSATESISEPETNPASQPEPQPAQRPEMNQAPQPEAKPAPQAESKSASPTETKGTPQQGVKPPVQAETKPTTEVPPAATSSSQDSNALAEQTDAALPSAVPEADVVVAGSRTMTVDGCQIVLNPGERLVSVNGVPVSTTKTGCCPTAPHHTCGATASCVCNRSTVCCDRTQVKNYRSRCCKRTWKRCRIWRG